MRDLDNYDIIYCDIDGTLIYGWYTTLMDITWRMFHSKQLAQFLMKLQYNLKLYKVNQVLRYMLVNTRTPLIFLTARGISNSTMGIIVDEIGGYGKPCKIVELETDNPETDKMIFIAKRLEKYPKACLFDDNKTTLETVGTLDIDTFDAVPMYEEKIN